jgi:hypothetical protein
MAETQVGFFNRFRSLILSDDTVRWRIMGWTIIAVGSIASVDFATGSSVKETVPLMAILTFLIPFVAVVWYCSIKPTYVSDSHGPSRRSLLYCLTASCAALVAGLLIEQQESRSADSQLSNAVAKNDFAQIASLLDRARNTSVRLDPAVSRKVVRRSLDAKFPGQPDAWEAVLASLNYKSFQDSAFNPALKPVLSAGEVLITAYYMESPIGMPKPKVKSFGIVPHDQAARLNQNGVDENTGRGNQFLILVSGWLTLDGMALRHIILQDVDVVYHGGPLEMADVYFLNCRFHIDQSRKSQELALAILDADPALSHFSAT